MFRTNLINTTKTLVNKSRTRTASTATATGISTKSQQFIDLESKRGAHNYHPIPVVIERGEGVNVWDVDGKVYYINYI